MKNVYNSTIFSSDVSSDISQNYTCFNLDAGPINSGNPNVPNVSDTLANSYTTGVYGNIDIVDTADIDATNAWVASPDVMRVNPACLAEIMFL